MSQALYLGGMEMKLMVSYASTSLLMCVILTIYRISKSVSNKKLCSSA